MGYSLFYMSHILFTFSSLFHKKTFGNWVGEK